MWIVGEPAAGKRLRANARAYYERQRDTVVASSVRWRKNNLERAKANARGWRLRKHYGITIADRNALLIAQENRCAACRTDTPGKHGWQTDHDHKTGKVRGILCVRCNTTIGRLGDTAESVRVALLDFLRYLGGEP